MWAQLLGLDLKYWSSQSLSKTTSLIRVPIMTDRITKMRTRTNYVWMLIEVEITDRLLNKVFFKNEYGPLLDQNVVFHWNPINYINYKGYGHN